MRVNLFQLLVRSIRIAAVLFIVYLALCFLDVTFQNTSPGLQIATWNFFTYLNIY